MTILILFYILHKLNRQSQIIYKDLIITGQYHMKTNKILQRIKKLTSYMELCRPGLLTVVCDWILFCSTFRRHLCAAPSGVLWLPERTLLKIPNTGGEKRRAEENSGIGQGHHGQQSSIQHRPWKPRSIYLPIGFKNM